VGGSSRRRILRAGLLGALAVSCSGPGPIADHLVLVTVDTLRADHLAAYGGTVETPTFDRIAREGALVERAITPVPSTGPAHASLLTGRHPWHHGVLANASALGPDPRTLAEHLRAAGFETVAFVSSFVLDERFGFARGFDHYELAATRPLSFRGDRVESFFARGEETMRRALAWIDVREGSGRFFLWIHLFDPHSPYAPPAAYLGPASETIPLESELTPRGFAKTQWRQHLRRYRGEIRYVDHQLARLLGALESRSLLERTALVVTADHGEGFGEHGDFGHGAHLHEAQIHVPLLVRAPGIPAGRRLRGVAQLEDLYPTALSLLALPQTGSVDGVDLADWLRGASPEPPRRVAFGRRRSYPGLRDFYFQTSAEQKWVGEVGAGGTAFDLQRDPGEDDGVAAPTPRELLARLAERPVDAVPRGERALDEESRAALEALGYLGEDGHGLVGSPPRGVAPPDAR